jgi:hypothetical protein
LIASKTGVLSIEVLLINTFHVFHIDKKITLAEKDLAVLLGSLFDRAIKAANQTSQERTIKVLVDVNVTG